MKLFRRKHQLEVQIQDNGAIIFDKSSGVYFQTNMVGVDIIQMLSQNKSENDIVHILADKYNESVEKTKEDVRDFIDSLKKGRLL